MILGRSAFGIFKDRTAKLITEEMVADWVAMENICYDEIWAIGIYSGYDLIDWAHRVGLLKSSERENWFNLLQN